MKGEEDEAEDGAAEGEAVAGEDEAEVHAGEDGAAAAAAAEGEGPRPPTRWVPSHAADVPFGGPPTWEEGIFDVEELLSYAENFLGEGPCYLVKWRGHEKRSWEPEKNLSGTADLCAAMAAIRDRCGAPAVKDEAAEGEAEDEGREVEDEGRSPAPPAPHTTRRVVRARPATMTPAGMAPVERSRRRNTAEGNTSSAVPGSPAAPT